MDGKIGLSVAIITRNEEENIAACLKSVAFAAQIVVVDSGSTDRTRAVAAEYGGEIHVEPWKGFGHQKQVALDYCRNSWILVLDADERVTEPAAEEITRIVSDQRISAAGYSFPRKNIFQGRWIRHAGWWPDRVTRLFRKDAGRMTPETVHESVAVSGRVEPLSCPLEHFTESRPSGILNKIDLYSTLGAEKSFKEGKTASVSSAVARAAFAFINNYLLRLGFLDGHQGLTLAAANAVNKFFKYAKLAELTRTAGTPRK
jgi:glycosyltransferase involved in cell wall biosynthesis